MEQETHPVCKMLALRLLALCSAIGGILTCSVMDWQEYSMERLLFEANIVVLGTDTQHIRGFNNYTDSIFKVRCVLKGDEETIKETIRIMRIDPGSSCQETEMYVGKSYIMTLKRYGGEYKWHVVNIMQSAALADTSENMNRALSVCGLQTPRQPDDAPPSDIAYCPNVTPTIQCVTGGATSYVAHFTVVLSALLYTLLL